MDGSWISRDELIGQRNDRLRVLICSPFPFDEGCLNVWPRALCMILIL